MMATLPVSGCLEGEGKAGDTAAYDQIIIRKGGIHEYTQESVFTPYTNMIYIRVSQVAIDIGEIFLYSFHVGA